MKLIKALDDQDIRGPLSGHQLGEPIELVCFDYVDVVQQANGLYFEVKESVTAKVDRPIYWYPGGRIVAYKGMGVRAEGKEIGPRVWVIPQERVVGMLLKRVEKTDVGGEGDIPP